MKRAATKTDISSNTISFFRRSIVLDEKFWEEKDRLDVEFVYSTSN
jgi:hypothetical protein